MFFKKTVSSHKNFQNWCVQIMHFTKCFNGGTTAEFAKQSSKKTYYEGNSTD
jgi:hypothetical protein